MNQSVIFLDRKGFTKMMVLPDPLPYYFDFALPPSFVHSYLAEEGNKMEVWESNRVRFTYYKKRADGVHEYREDLSEGVNPHRPGK